MKRMLSLLLALSLAWPVAVMAGSTQCARYHAILEGTVSPQPGYTVNEIVEIHKVDQTSGYNGKWQVDKLTQIMTYPYQIRPPVSTANRTDFKDGQWMNCELNSLGNEATMVCSGGQLFIDVQGNKIGSKKNGTWTGTITGKQIKFQFYPQNPMEPVVTGEIRKPEKKQLTVSILSPVAEKHAFSSANPGVLELVCAAQVTPSEYEQDIQWNIPEIEGSTLTIDPPTAKGPQITVKYKGLPADNNQFGPRSIQAVVNVGGCIAEDTKGVNVFYIRDATNNPEGQYPNWFYYWKQTPAARPRGQFVNIEYGGNTFNACADPGCRAQFTPGYAYCTIHVCDLLSKLGVNFKNRFPLLSVNPPYHNGWATSKHIDTYATAIIHEYVHWLAYHNWKHGKTNDQLHAEDSDKDGVPDVAEPDFYFDLNKFQTHFANHPELKKIGGDEEWLAYSSMSEIQLGSLDKYDWGYPGKNWP